MKAIVKAVGGVVGVGVAAFAGTSAVDDNTTRDEAGAIVESGGLGAHQMQVGDCFIDPDPNAELVQSVEGVPCTTPHDGEVFAEYEFGGPSTPYPGEEALYEQAWWDCLDRFEAWVGAPYEESVLGISTFTQTQEGWDMGLREITCIVYDYRGHKLSVSTKGRGH